MPKNANAAELMQSLLEHIGRYRLTVLDGLEQLPLFGGMQAKQIRRLLWQMEHRKLVASASLYRGSTYWYLLPKGAAQLHLDTSRFGILSEQAKFRAFALLTFCCRNDKPRVRLTPQELTVYLPDCQRMGLPSTYYYDASGSGQLGFVRVDAGHHGRWDRVVQTLREDISAHLRRPAWERLVKADRFEFTVLTVFPEKAERIRETVEQNAFLRRSKVQVVALPELFPLISLPLGKEVNSPLSARTP